MHAFNRLSILFVLSLALGGCGIVYKPNIQQGNLLQKKEVQQLHPGMTKTQVIALLGTPSVTSPFDTNRWDYVSTFQHRGGKIVQHIMTVIFKNDALVRTEGNYFAQNAKQMLKASKAYEGDYNPSLQKSKKPHS